MEFRFFLLTKLVSAQSFILFVFVAKLLNMCGVTLLDVSVLLTNSKDFMSKHLQSAAYTVRRSKVLLDGLGLTMALLGEEITLTKPVGEVLFEGYEVGKKKKYNIIKPGFKFDFRVFF